MKAITLTQPWATLVIAGVKEVETRSWRTPHRGTLGIHAAKGFPRWAMGLCEQKPFRSSLESAGFARAEDLPRGVLLGSVDLLDCSPTTSLAVVSLSDLEWELGDYDPERWAWFLANPRPIEPRPMRGALGLWETPE